MLYDSDTNWLEKMEYLIRIGVNGSQFSRRQLRRTLRRDGLASLLEGELPHLCLTGEEPFEFFDHFDWEEEGTSAITEIL